MCGYTIITYTECTHDMLSTTPQHTRLCAYALMVELVQGIDTAPPPCVLCSSTTTQISASQKLFDYCPDCRPIVDAEDPERTQRGELDDVLQTHAHIKEDDVGVYDEAETSQLFDLRVYIDLKMKAGMALAETLETHILTNPSALSRIPSPTLRALLSFPGRQKYENLYLSAFRTCADMLPVLEMYVQRKVSHQLFMDTFKWVHDKALRTNAVLDTFHIVVQAVVEGGGYEARLDFFGDVLVRAVEGGWGEGEVEDGEGDVHPLAEEEEARVDVPVKTVVKTGPKKLSRKEAGTLNLRGLNYDSKSLEGLLEHEPAEEIKLDILYIPEGVNGMGVDVEDEQGNKLVWDGEGNSRLICASESDDTTLGSTINSASPDTEPPAAKPESTATIEVPKPKKVAEGFCFSYSDTDSTDEADNNGPVRLRRDDVVEPSPISIAAGPMNPQSPASTPSPPPSLSSSSSSPRKRKSSSDKEEDSDDDHFDPPVQPKRRKPSPLPRSASMVRRVPQPVSSGESVESTSSSSSASSSSSVKRNWRHLHRLKQAQK
ncbi:hypothetical protein PTNB29_01228 [Pyrenophora teres f. teres]|nr:hypothetical protein PTNB29_01228 [Pyrenophora teres f. teres]